MTKKYTLKPGKHQFAPGSHAVHQNDNFSDEEAEWYLEKYPHIAGLFVETLEGCKVEMLENGKSESVENQITDESKTEITTSEIDQHDQPAQ